MTAPPTTGRGERRFLAAAGVLALAAYLGIVTGGAYDLDGQSRFGMVFNAMALNLVHGRFDIDPDVILFEAFFRDGRTYAYFGILSALLRLPLMPFVDLATVEVARPMMALAAALAAVFQAQAALRATRHAAGDGGWLRALLAALPFVSGPQVYLLGAVDMYGEASLWGLCFASATVAAAVHLTLHRGRPATHLYALVAASAGLCLLARVSIGIGACGLAAATVLTRLWCEAAAAGPARAAKPLAAAAVAGGIPVAFALFVNHARWGNALEFADPRRQLNFEALHPGFLARLNELGAANLERVWFGLQYYLAPVWAFPTADGTPRFEAWMHKWLFGAELPAATPLVTDPLLLALAVLGVAALARGRLPPPATVAWAAGAAALAVPAAMLTTLFYMSLRYRVDFQPLMLWLALAGATTLCGRPPGRLVRRGVPALFAASVVGSGLVLALNLDAPFGPAFPTADPFRELYWALAELFGG
ncbi:MAG: hypothetical protein AB7K86_13950 [Rhodospirillales bacterium]